MTERSVTHATFCIERLLEASPARVFAAWSDAQARYRWFVSGEGFAIAEYAHDFRVGGHEHSRFSPTKGQAVFTNDTWYLDIVPDERIVFTYTMDQDGRRFSVSLATVQIRPEGSGSRLTFTEMGAFLEGADGPDMRESGWNQLLDAFEAELARGDHAGRECA